MLSLEQAAAQQETYVPRSEQTRRALSRIILAPIVAPSAVGKNYLIRQLVQDLAYHHVGGSVTRSPRPSDEPNIRHDTLEEALRAIDEGTVVQYATTSKGDVYSTSPQDYSQETINVKDIISRSIGEFGTYGFRSVRPIGLVVAPSMWRQRLVSRTRGMSTAEIKVRLDEAEESTQWLCEENVKPKLLVVANGAYDDTELERISSYITDDTDGGTNSSEQHELAHEMRTSIPSLRQLTMKA